VLFSLVWTSTVAKALKDGQCVTPVGLGSGRRVYKSKYEVESHEAMITQPLGSAHMSFPDEQRHSPWLAVAGTCAIYICFGMAIAVMAPLVDEITDDLSLSRTMMGSILGAWTLIYIFTSVPAGAFVDRVGLRRSLSLGGLTIAATLLLRSVASGPITLFLAVAVFGIGGPLVSIATPKLIASLFEEDARRLPTGLAVASPTLGSAIALALTNPVLLPLMNNSWRGVLALLGGVSLLVALAWWLYVGRSVAHVPTSAQAFDPRRLKRLLRMRSLRWILVMSVFVFFFSHGLNSWLPEILTDSGQSDNAAGYLAAMSVIAGITGALTISRWVRASVRAQALIGTSLVLSVTVVALGVLPYFLLLAALAVMGFARAGFIPLMFLSIMDDPEISLADMGAATGLFFAVSQLGGFSGPYALGYVADQTNGFGASTVLLAVVALAAGAAALGLKRSQLAN